MDWLYSITVKWMESSEKFFIYVQVNGVNIYIGGVMSTQRMRWLLVFKYIHTYTHTIMSTHANVVWVG